MQMKQYPEKKRQILAKHSVDDVDDFVKFLEEIKGKSTGSLQQMLTPSKGGYRKKGKLKREVRHSIFKQFITKLKAEKGISNLNSDVWKQFEKIFMLWIQSHPGLFEILEDFKNEEDFNKDTEHIADSNSKLDIQCFKTLLEASHNNQIDQETIQRFYEYGYFLPSDEIESLIGRSRPRAEIERQQQLEGLPDQVNQLSKAIDLLKSRLSAIESTDETAQELNQRIAEAIEPLESQLSKTKSRFDKTVNQLSKSINLRLSQVEESVESLETQLSDAEFVNNMREEFARLDQCLQESVQSFGTRFNEIDRAIAEIRTEREAQHQTTDAPRIAHQAVQIGERYDTQLRMENDRYSDENDDYLSNFKFSLRRFGVIGSDGTIDADEIADAIHVALKAFPALEVADTRIIDVWQLMCGNHLHVTKIDVEMGWLGLQDWFPKLFSQECFEEQLRRMDLDSSIRKMLERGNMPWAIHFSNCDRSFPDIYLPRFIDWIGDFSENAIRVFLTRCSGMNRCETNQDVYERVARLPKPQGPEPIEARNLRPLDIITRSEWESWCCWDANANPLSEAYREFLNQLQSEIENVGVQIPMPILREIQQYLRLSQGILVTSKALDWALTLRLLPWIGNRRKLIDAVQNLMNQENRELPHFQDGLLYVREENE